ncbi:uncharacterized protein JCM6883_005033 [Sporobolomyces salmoneus]|uniref:uncharacterized protein n=1 Tax=Sporobolomyces salmoneus TaxID=183962 RepID=UPI003180666E
MPPHTGRSRSVSAGPSSGPIKRRRSSSPPPFGRHNVFTINPHHHRPASVASSASGFDSPSDYEEDEEDKPHEDPVEGSDDGVPVKTDDMSRIKWTLRLIERFCSNRGELIKGWIDSVRNHLSEDAGFDLAYVLKSLELILDRFEKGEFLATFNESSKYADVINSEFKVSNIFVKGKGKKQGHPISHSKRLMFGNCAKLDLLLEEKIYHDARAGHLAPFSAEDFEASVSKIVKAFQSLWFDRHFEAKEWKDRILALYENRHKQNDARLRWNLIVVSERVRTREVLPELEEIFNSILSTPRNVPLTVNNFFH